MNDCVSRSFLSGRHIFWLVAKERMMLISREEFKMNKLITICLVVVLGAASTTLAAPTRHVWYFQQNDPMPAADVVENEIGPASLRVTPGPVVDPWKQVLDGRPGVWALSGEIDVIIPNNPALEEYKTITIDLVWKPGGIDDFMPDMPLVGVSAVPMNSMEMTKADDLALGDGWWHSHYDIIIRPNPPEEWIAVKGDILVDELAIETECVPEPATMGLLSLGGLALLRFRRKR